MIVKQNLHFLNVDRWLIVGLLVTFLSVTVHAQQDWEKEGGIPNAEIEIIKDRKITLPSADRNFEKIPPRPAEPIQTEITYSFKNLKFNTADFKPVIRPLKLKQEDISKIYGNYISAGYGNYASPYLEAYFNAKRDKNKFYGAHFYHHSFGNGPVDDKNSASGNTRISLFGKAISNSVVASGNLDFENTAGYFYGYTPSPAPERESIRQEYNILGLSAGVENARPADFTYNLKFNYSYLADHLKASEHETSLAFGGDYKINDKSGFGIIADYFLINRKDPPQVYNARNLFRVKPAYRLVAIDKLWLTLGANIAYEDDAVDKKSVHVYPNVRADYSLGESVTAYAGITGDIDKVSLHTLSRENFWVTSNLNIYHTNRATEFLSGLKGKLGKKVAFGAGVSLSTLKNFYAYQNSSVDRSKFDLHYGNTNRANVFAELGFNPGTAVKMNLRGDYFSYTSNWVYHRPTYRVAFNSSYNIYNKLLLNLDFIGQGGMKALNTDLFVPAVISIKPAVDLNFKIDYLISRKVSAFLKFNNILSNSYQVYYHYPVRGFQAMGGVSWSF
jgi:hypothetical protein